MKSMTLDERTRNTIVNLYRYSDLSVVAIAEQVDVEANRVQEIVDELTKDEALDVLIEQSITNVKKIMSPIVISLDCSKTVYEAAALIAEKQIGSVIVTKNNKPFGIVTHSDIARWVGLRQQQKNLLDSTLEDLASRPLLTLEDGANVEQAASFMLKNRIHRLPIIRDAHDDKLIGIVTITDLAVFLSPSRRPGLASLVLQAISRGRTK